MTDRMPLRVSLRSDKPFQRSQVALATPLAEFYCIRVRLKMFPLIKETAEIPKLYKSYDLIAHLTTLKVVISKEH